MGPHRKGIMDDFHLGMVAALIAPTDPSLAWEMAEHADDQGEFEQGVVAMYECIGYPE